MLSRARQTQQQKQPTASASNASVVTAPAISLPKRGGAIRGIGEKFAANLVTGTGSLTVPVVTSPGHSGFGQQLNLTYVSGSGDRPFGFGWLRLPSDFVENHNDAGAYIFACQPLKAYCEVTSTG